MRASGLIKVGIYLVFFSLVVYVLFLVNVVQAKFNVWLASFSIF